MTPRGARIAAIAGWDDAGVDAGVGRLAALAGDLPGWRVRVEHVGLRLQDGYWSGQAGRAAAGSVLALAAVTAALAERLTESLVSCRRAADAVGSAAATARAAQVVGADPTSLERLSAVAVERAEEAAVAWDAAGTPLAGVGADRSAGPAAFADLEAHVLPLPLPAPPTTGPGEVASWWARLPVIARTAFLQQRPAVAGALDGLPAADRDRANRLLLARALRGRGPSPTARAFAAELAVQEAAGRSVQLHLFDEVGERVALAVGDLDAADSVVVLVPGIATTPDDDLDAVTADVVRAVEAAGDAGAVAVAGVAWLGYRPPRGAGILLRRRAVQAGPVLAAALAGMSAARGSRGCGLVRTTVLAHSYGTVVVDEAADAPGPLAADAVVLLGSPGMEPDAAALEADEVYDAASPTDPISTVGWFGASPWAPGYGAQELPIAPGTGHSGYLDPGPTLRAVGAVVAGPGEEG